MERNGTFLGILIALGISRIEGSDLFMLFQSILGFLAPPMATVFLLGVIWKSTTPQAANLTLSIGSVVSIGVGVCALLGYPEVNWWPHPLLLSFFLFVGLVLFITIISWFTQSGYQGSPMQGISQTLVWSDENKMVWMLWGVLTVVMVCLYVFFN